ncbi:hypothetical protein FSW04_05275 [Baekduia soli]|uniref:VOC domain-containing protein n=1 Tax=Baekduia soli TaxID=496014 RepID=A0A5B8U2G6_9ACTN|nr:VOC family protein [Baekduia soli]QEC47055.1 hypothetical protein FSW04_05275 [Baekduia soli]
MTIANDHQAVRVTDMERSTRFYVEAFDATVLTRPFVIEGDFAEAMMGGPPGVRFRIRHLRFEQGVVELFEFLEPVVRAEPAHGSRASILHLGFRVDDVDATVARVLDAGGRLLLPVTAWGGARLTFCADPDGNVVELADASIEQLVTATVAAFPEAAPDAPDAVA